MKKAITAVLCICFLCVNIGVFAAPKELSYGDYRYSTDGVLTYVAENTEQDYIYLPGEINGTTITRVADRILAGTRYDLIIVDAPIEEIGEGAFENSEIGGIILPYSIRYIGDRAFANCKKLDQVDFVTVEELELGEECFAETNGIVFSAHCTTDFDRMNSMLASAKGDDNFSIFTNHSFTDEYTDEMQCIACGAFPEDVPFPAVIKFEDVPEDSWYYNFVSVATFFGVLNGKEDGKFDPEANVTLGEAAKIAACIHSLERGAYDSFPEAEPWYQPYVDYCYMYNVVEYYVDFDWEREATRAEIAYLFSRADIAVDEINPDVPLTDIPDVHASTSFANEILDLYRRGIAVGNDEHYTFCPNEGVKRNEIAAFVARILNPPMRVELPKG